MPVAALCEHRGVSCRGLWDRCIAEAASWGVGQATSTLGWGVPQAAGPVRRAMAVWATAYNACLLEAGLLGQVHGRMHCRCCCGDGFACVLCALIISR